MDPNIAHRENSRNKKAQEILIGQNTEKAHRMREMEHTRKNEVTNNENSAKVTRGFSRQAAAEEEHALVHGTDKGRTITRR